MKNYQEIRKNTLLTNQCGCYLFENKRGEVIYVGKAQNLKNRISSYWQKQTSPYGEFFRQQIHNFSTIITHNVKEALILEQNLIKKYQPRFNVLLKDSHFYPYIEITNEKNPRYKLVRKIDPQKNSEYYGPFPDGSKAREILQLLERLFPLVKCKINPRKSDKDRKPCFYYTINQCSGYCWQEVDPDYYQKTREQVRQFFHGKTYYIKKKIRLSLQKNIENLAFEIAQKEKKILDNIDFFISKQNVEFKKEESYDFLGIYWHENIISFFLLIYRYGKLTSTDEANFLVWTDKEEIIQSYLYQFYQKNLSPKVLYLSELIVGSELLTDEFGFLIKVPRRGRKKDIINLAQQNAQQVWQRNYWNEFQQVDKGRVLIEIGNFLSIPPPYYIECLDISNLYKQNIVAGFLTFINGEKNLTKSKLYKLGSNDYRPDKDSDIARVEKAVLIHYRNFSPHTLPNLIIVDGGSEQVKAVLKALKILKLKTEVIGLAKDSKHQTAKIITSSLKELDFGGREKIKNFLTNCQDEVHRYAINFHRKLHRQSTLHN